MSVVSVGTIFTNWKLAYPKDLQTLEDLGGHTTKCLGNCSLCSLFISVPRDVQRKTHEVNQKTRKMSHALNDFFTMGGAQKTQEPLHI